MVKTLFIVLSGAVISVIIWIVGSALTVLLFFVVLFLSIVLYPFDKERKVVNAQGFWWASILIGLNPFWKLQINGLENIDNRKAYVIVANHQSVTDILALYKTYTQFRWVAKESLFKIPFLGWCLLLGKHIRLSRERPISIKKAYQEVADRLHNNVSVLFFPEGTRSKTGKMNKFQNGAFKLAIKEKKPILPICITGTKDALPKGSWIFRTKVFARLTVLPQVDTAHLHSNDYSHLRDAVYTKLKNALEKYS